MKPEKFTLIELLVVIGHHRDSGLHAAARVESGARKGVSDNLHFELEPDRDGHAGICR